MSPHAPDISGFFFDNNVSPLLAAGMKAFGEPVWHLRELWPDRDPGDDVWMPEDGRRGLILVTYDLGIKRKPDELALFRDCDLGGFFLSCSHYPGRWEQIEQIVRQWRLLRDTARSTPRPFMFKVRTRGQKLTPMLRG